MFYRVEIIKKSEIPLVRSKIKKKILREQCVEYRMIRGEWVIVYAKSHSRECALPMKAMPLNSLKAVSSFTGSSPPRCMEPPPELE